jgi:hypothetical protein
MSLYDIASGRMNPYDIGLVALMPEDGKVSVRNLVRHGHLRSTFHTGRWTGTDMRGFSGFQNRHARFQFGKPLRHSDQAFPNRNLFEDFGNV